MAFVVCKQCGKIYDGQPDAYCPRCMMDINDGFTALFSFLNSGRIRTPDGKYIQKAKTLTELSEKTKVPEWIIIKLLREEKLDIKYTLEGGLECEVCHTPITVGEMCDKCKSELSTQLYVSLKDRKVK
jgi:hypothetical protein